MKRSLLAVAIGGTIALSLLLVLLASGRSAMVNLIDDPGPAALGLLGVALLLGHRLLLLGTRKREASNGSILGPVALPDTAPVLPEPPPVAVRPDSVRPLVARSAILPAQRATRAVPLAPQMRSDANDATVVDSFAAIRSMLLAPGADGDEAITAPHSAQGELSDQTVVDSYASMRARMGIN
jgi:hypothetical protein